MHFHLLGSSLFTTPSFSQAPAMRLDYSKFSISNALGPFPQQCSSSSTTTMTTMTVAPQEHSAEQEPCDQQNHYDVNITSFPTHSFHPTPQHQHFIYPRHSFSHTSQGYVKPLSDSIYSIASPHGCQENSFQSAYPFVTWVASQQPHQPNLIHPFAEIALAHAGRPASQNQPSDAVNSIIHPTTPLIYPESRNRNYERSFSRSRPSTGYVPPVPLPVVPIPVFHSPAEQGLFQSNSQGDQQLDGSSARLSRPSHDTRASTQLPRRFSSVDSPRTSYLGKRPRRMTSDPDVAELETTTKDFRPASISSIRRTVPLPHIPLPHVPRSSVSLRVQHANVTSPPRMGISHTAPRKVECDGHMVDECAVEKAIGNGQRLLHVYECKWNKNHSPCHMYIEGDQSSVTDHLLRFHDFTGGEENTTCLWDSCRSRRQTAMKGTSIARHLVTHIGHKVKCGACGVVFAREDACKRSHINPRSDCRTMQMDPVPSDGAIVLTVQDSEPVVKKIRLADS